MAMRLLIVAALAAVSAPAFADNTLTDRDRAAIAQQQQARQIVLERARARCVVNRGTDCNTEEGLQEWLMLDRSREAAVLDRVSPLSVPSGSPPALSSGSGATTPAAGR
jgi:type II secretory pathway pseudopilin PulG